MVVLFYKGIMSVNKPWNSFQEQAKKLINRNLEADEEELTEKLKSVNYYRLSGYFHTFYETDYTKSPPIKIDKFRKGTSFNLVWNYYRFDRNLRFLVVDAIERIEITLRTSIAYYWSYYSKCNTPHKNINSFSKFQNMYKNSKEEWAIHYKQKTSDILNLPVWVFCELWSFGDIRHIFSNRLNTKIRRAIHKQFKIKNADFFNYILYVLNAIRNSSAHHCRIWNKQWLSDNQRFDIHDAIYKEGGDWNLIWNKTKENWEIPNKLTHNTNTFISWNKNSTAFVLTICRYLLKQIAPQSRWKQRLYDLLNHPDTPRNVITEMGFVGEWKNHPIWKD
ncbi:Abi family protein [Akkermansia muciniphila]|uniref:Abi family protein n=1 Tax=Akkermansia muciniphila TaxID=239935 RepID=UPI001969127A|nr:Abi family protein [Akkermansia muciniphila]